MKRWMKKFGIYVLLIGIVVAVSAGVTGAVVGRSGHDMSGEGDHVMSAEGDHARSGTSATTGEHRMAATTVDDKATSSFASTIASPESGKPPLKVAFRAVDLGHAMFGAVIKYGWDFGDGAKAEGLTAEHTYTQKGNYTVTLTIFYQDGTQQVDKKGIQVG